MNLPDLPETLRWQNNQLQLLDQRRLPAVVEYLQIQSLQDAWHAINTLAVRGAPAIGVAAGYALAQASLNWPRGEAWLHELAAAGDYLKSARPTAVNLAWAVDRLTALGQTEPEPDTLIAAAQAIHNEDIALCQGMGQHGSTLITAGMGVLTHCNAGALATTGIGTATAPMYYQHAQQVPFTVYADETRPLYQGARLTAWELSRAGISTRLLCDNMAATLMAQGKIDMAIVGTDRVAANGDVVNKIGTLAVAIACQHFGIPFYVACPSSTFDAHTPTGAQVVIEQRADTEVLPSSTGTYGAAFEVLNPAFDVTPAALVSGIITEHGISPAADLQTFLAGLQ